MLTKREERNQRGAEQRRRNILDAIGVAGERTAKQIAEDAGLSTSSVFKYLRELRQPGMKFVYIVRWLPSDVGGSAAPAYALGNRPDAAKPKMGGPVIDSEAQMAREAAKKLRRIKAPAAVNDPFLAWIPRKEHREAA